MNGREHLIAQFLKLGVIVSGLFMFIGQIKSMRFSEYPFFNFQTYDQIPLKELINYYIKLKDWGILSSYIGLFVLILLPFIRVIMTIFIFLRNKEYALSGIALIVLSGLFFSLYLGIRV